MRPPFPNFRGWRGRPPAQDLDGPLRRERAAREQGGRTEAGSRQDVEDEDDQERKGKKGAVSAREPKAAPSPSSHWPKMSANAALFFASFSNAAAASNARTLIRSRPG